MEIIKKNPPYLNTWDSNTLGEISALYSRRVDHDGRRREIAHKKSIKMENEFAEKINICKALSYNDALNAIERRAYNKYHNNPLYSEYKSLLYAVIHDYRVEYAKKKLLLTDREVTELAKNKIRNYYDKEENQAERDEIVKNYRDNCSRRLAKQEKADVAKNYNIYKNMDAEEIIQYRTLFRKEKYYEICIRTLKDSIYEVADRKGEDVMCLDSNIAELNLEMEIENRIARVEDQDPSEKNLMEKIKNKTIRCFDIYNNNAFMICCSIIMGLGFGVVAYGKILFSTDNDLAAIAALAALPPAIAGGLLALVKNINLEEHKDVVKEAERLGLMKLLVDAAKNERDLQELNEKLYVKYDDMIRGKKNGL